jgi:hypothetical protein
MGSAALASSGCYLGIEYQDFRASRPRRRRILLASIEKVAKGDPGHPLTPQDDLTIRKLAPSGSAGCRRPGNLAASPKSSGWGGSMVFWTPSQRRELMQGTSASGADLPRSRSYRSVIRLCEAPDLVVTARILGATAVPGDSEQNLAKGESIARELLESARGRSDLRRRRPGCPGSCGCSGAPISSPDTAASGSGARATTTRSAAAAPLSRLATGSRDHVSGGSSSEGHDQWRSTASSRAAG